MMKRLDGPKRVMVAPSGISRGLLSDQSLRGPVQRKVNKNNATRHRSRESHGRDELRR
jgi:hypothetical protein